MTTLKRYRAVLVLALAAVMALTGYTIAQDRPREMTPEQREREIHELEVRLDQLRSQARRDRPERGPRMPHPGMMHARMEMTERLVEMNSEPGQAGLLAIGALAREIPLEPARRIEVLEATLEATESLPLRNALRFALKDLYLRTEQVDKAVGVMRDLLAENDEVLADYIARDCDEDDDEADDEDEEDDDEAGDEHRE